MTLLQLKYFCTACENSSVTKAAERLYVTQPTITTAIRQLEKEYQIQLLDRKDKILVLTEEGRQFYQSAQVLLHHAVDFDRQIKNMARQKGYVRLGLSKLVGSNTFTEYVQYGLQQHPSIDMVFHSGSTSELLRELKNHNLDVILISNHEGEWMETVEYAPLKTTDMLYCVSREHPLAKESVVTLEQILHVPMVSTCQDEKRMMGLNRLFKEAGYPKGPNVIQRFEQINVVFAMIRRNVGAGYFPQEGLAGYEGIVGKKIQGDHPVQIYAVWTKEAWQKKEVQIFIKTICRFFHECYIK